TVDGVPADNVVLNDADTTATFTFNSNPVTAQGPHTMHIAPGSISKLGDPSTTISDFTGIFYYDAVTMQVLSTNPPIGSTFLLPRPFLYDASSSECVDPASVQASDLLVTGLPGASVTGVSFLNSNTTVQFTISGITTEGAVSVNIAAGAINDAFG